MAGDIDMPEALFPGIDERGRPMPAPGPLLHDYGLRVRIGIGGGGAPGAPINEEELSSQERLGLSAFRMRLSDSYKGAKSDRAYAGAEWGGGDGDRPRLHRDERAIVRGAPILPEPEDGPAPAPEARRLSGRVAVGIVLVSGPGRLAMSSGQKQKIIAEIQNGLSYLGGAAPARDVTFVYDIKEPQIALPDTTGEPPAGSGIDAQYEFYERPWRDGALAAMGFQPGGNGIRSYIRQIKAEKRAQAAYCCFFTHYRLYHFAYCSGSYLTISYENDGWGVDNLDRVFAHETGHVFGAPDEYAESGCNCGGSWGFFGRPNLNCENCADGGGVSCIMKRNSWDMCSETPFHLGYVTNVA